MKNDGKKKLNPQNSTIYQTNENCQVFNGPISGCVFAMPGATVNQSPIQQVGAAELEVQREPATDNQERPVTESVKPGVRSAELNHFAPKKALQSMLNDAWFDGVSVDKRKYNIIWRQSLVEALMKSDYAKDIATEWTEVGKRLQVRGAFVGALKDVGVLAGSYNSIAPKLGVTDIDAASLAKYMGYGKKKSYYEWLKLYVRQD
jgi:hypothetical protein